MCRPGQTLVDGSGEFGPVERTDSDGVAELGEERGTFRGSIEEGLSMVG